MTVSEDLITRLSSETGRRLGQQARAGRRHALSGISHVVVTVTEDGRRTWEETFAHPPTLAQLAARVGQRAYVVAVAMRRKSVRNRTPLRLAAE